MTFFLASLIEKLSYSVLVIALGAGGTKINGAEVLTLGSSFFGRRL